MKEQNHVHPEEECQDFKAFFPQIDEIIISQTESDDTLMTVLQGVQRLLGYLPPEIMSYISGRLAVPTEKIYSVVAGYPFFSLTPRGDHIVTVCLGANCFMQGANEILNIIQKELKIRVGQTTTDRKFTLLAGTCCEASEISPVIMVDKNIHEAVRPSQVKQILDSYR